MSHYVALKSAVNREATGASISDSGAPTAVKPVLTPPRRLGLGICPGGLHAAGRCAKPVSANVTTSVTSPSLKSAAHSQHCPDPLQERIAAFHRQGPSGVHDGLKLIVGQAKHAPHDNSETPQI